MNKYQKIAALAIRTVSLLYFCFIVISTIPAIFTMPHAIWVMISPLVGSLIIFILATPIAHLVAFGIDDSTK